MQQFGVLVQVLFGVLFGVLFEPLVMVLAHYFWIDSRVLGHEFGCWCRCCFDAGVIIYIVSLTKSGCGSKNRYFKMEPLGKWKCGPRNPRFAPPPPQNFEPHTI